MAHDPRPAAPASSRTDTAEVSVVTVDTLDQWLSFSWKNGVQIDHLDDLNALRVETLNSTYDLAIVAARTGEILVRGGRYFPDWTSAQLVGCSLGGGLLKRHGVHVGFNMEFYSAGRLILTSPVRAINRAPEARYDTTVSTPGEPAPDHQTPPAR